MSSFMIWPSPQKVADPCSKVNHLQRIHLLVSFSSEGTKANLHCQFCSHYSQKTTTLIVTELLSVTLWSVFDRE